MTAPAEESLRSAFINSLPTAGEAVEPLDRALVQRLSDALGPNYVLGERIARGGFCEILECLDRGLDRRLAVKLLRPDVGGTHDMRSRFRQEARAIARLNHPNIIPIHFVGDAGGLAYYAMPFVPGRTLADLLGDAPSLPARRLVPLLIPVLEALHHAHQHGIVHRDIKPDNILLEDETNRPLLLDFGIAKCLTGPAHQTQAGFIVGTPLYMSPEQALGRDPVDARSDVYAFGVMMFQLLTGRAPYEGQTSQEIVGRHLGDPVPSPAQRDASVPAWLSAVVVRCLAKNPAERWQSARELAEALRAGSTGAEYAEGPRTPVPDEVPPVRGLPFALDMPPKGPRYTRRGIAMMLGGAGLAAALAFAFLRPAGTATVTVANELLNPVVLTLADGTDHTLAAGDSLRLPWAPDEAFDAQWQLVRPLSAEGRPMGEALSGTLHERKPRGEVRARIDVNAVDGEYFAPRVTNASGIALRFAVEGQGGAPLCNCVVPTGSDAEPMGYYRVGPRTVVRIRDGQEREVAYEMPHPIRERGTGALLMRVDASHLPEGAARPVVSPGRSTPPVHRVAARTPPSRRDVLAATAVPAPVPVVTPTAVRESAVAAPAPVTPPPATAPVAPRPSHPAAGFLPVR
jgi:hypothetical protein